VPLDLSVSAGFADLVAATEAKVGRIDMLINNAGISQRSLARDTLLAIDRHLMEVDYFGAVALTKAVLPAMLRRRSGHIVTVTSVAGKLGTPLRSGYCAAKHALHGFFDSLRAELWRERIRVSLVCPGFVRTGLPMVALTGDGRPQGRMDAAAARGIAPEQVARRMLDRLAAGQDEIVIAGGKERLALWLKRLAPTILDRVMRTARVT
jgi:short-subunit dehydrogenase